MERFLSFELHQRRLAVETMANLLFLSTEKRLMPILLPEDSHRRADSTHSGCSQKAPKFSYQVLADMVGTTRPRIALFMSKFRKAALFKDGQGLIDKRQVAFLLKTGKRP